VGRQDKRERDAAFVLTPRFHRADVNEVWVIEEAETVIQLGPGE
jgi:hypothetical protein